MTNINNLILNRQMIVIIHIHWIVKLFSPQWVADSSHYFLFTFLYIFLQSFSSFNYISAFFLFHLFYIFLTAAKLWLTAFADRKCLTTNSVSRRQEWVSKNWRTFCFVCAYIYSYRGLSLALALTHYTIRIIIWLCGFMLKIFPSFPRWVFR